MQAYLVLLYFTVLSFTGTMCCFFFFKLKGCGNPTSSKSFGTIFPIACAHFVPLSYVGNSCVFQTFKLQLSVMVTCDQ